MANSQRAVSGREGARLAKVAAAAKPRAREVRIATAMSQLRAMGAEAIDSEQGALVVDALRKERVTLDEIATQSDIPVAQVRKAHKRGREAPRAIGDDPSARQPLTAEQERPALT